MPTKQQREEIGSGGRSANARVDACMRDFFSQPSEFQAGQFASFLEYATSMTEIEGENPDAPAVDLPRVIGFSVTMLTYVLQLLPAAERGTVAAHAAQIIAAAGGGGARTGRG
jgi:hypothetical protein